MRLKKYIEFINEELREEEFNAILDKIHKKEPLTDEEQKSLDEFDGEFDTSPKNKVDFDAQGDLRIDGKRMNPYDIPKELYDEDERMEDFKPTELDDDLKEYLIDHLERSYERRNVAGAHKKQFFDETNQLVLPEELIRKTLWQLEIGDIPGVREFIKNWIESGDVSERKYIKTFQESLETDFDETIKDDMRDRTMLSSFSQLLDGKVKQEFQYRISDGEDPMKVVEDFLERIDEIEDKEDPQSRRSLLYHGRHYIMGRKLEEIPEEEKKFVGEHIGTIWRYQQDGPEKWIKMIEDIEKEDGGEDLREYMTQILKFVRQRLKANQDLSNWANLEEDKEGGINQHRIDAIDEMLELLSK